MGLVRKNFKFRFLGSWKTWVVTLCEGKTIVMVAHFSLITVVAHVECFESWWNFFLLHLCFVEHNKNQNMQYCDISSRLPIFWCCHVRDSSFLEGKPTDKLCWTDKNICISLKWDLQENSIQPTIIWVYISLITTHPQKNFELSLTIILWENKYHNSCKLKNWRHYNILSNHR
jgi:hypothetical protein